jgi:RNA polymerase sigma factor (sigma-70 family)
MRTGGLETTSDAALARAFVQGDEAALGALYDRFMPGIYDFLARFLNDRFGAEDVAQMTFVRAWENRQGLRDPQKVKSWLFAIAHNLATNHATRTRLAEPIDERFDLASTAPGPEDQAAAREVAELVWAAAASLEPRQYAVLDLCVRRELATGEIAEVLGVPAGHAAVLVSRAKEALGNAVRYLLVARRRDHCVRLAELVPAGVTSLTPEQRSSVDRHMRRCPECQGLARKLTMPAELFGGLVAFPVPASVQHDRRDFVLVSSRRRSGQGGGRPATSGASPAVAGPHGRFPWPRLSRRATALAVTLLLLLGVAGAGSLYLSRPGAAVPNPLPAAGFGAQTSLAGRPSAPAPSSEPPVGEGEQPGAVLAAGGGGTPGTGDGGRGSGGSTYRGPGSGGVGGSTPTPSIPQPAPAPSPTPWPAPTETPTVTPPPTPTTTPTPTPTPTPAPTPTPTPRTTPAPTATPTPPPAPTPRPFLVSQVGVVASGPPTRSSCLPTAVGYVCDFTVQISYSNPPPQGTVEGSLSGTAAEPGGTSETEVARFSIATDPSTDSVSGNVSLYFTTNPCLEASTAHAGSSRPNEVSSGVIPFGNSCVTGVG